MLFSSFFNRWSHSEYLFSIITNKSFRKQKQQTCCYCIYEWLKDIYGWLMSEEKENSSSSSITVVAARKPKGWKCIECRHFNNGKFRTRSYAILSEPHFAYRNLTFRWHFWTQLPLNGIGVVYDCCFYFCLSFL